MTVYEFEVIGSCAVPGGDVEEGIARFDYIIPDPAGCALDTNLNCACRCGRDINDFSRNQAFNDQAVPVFQNVLAYVVS